MPDYAPIWRIKASFVSKYRGEGCPRSRSTNCSIQGRSDKLKPLLNTLSYRHNGTSFANSDAHRTAIFLGISRKPTVAPVVGTSVPKVPFTASP